MFKNIYLPIDNSDYSNACIDLGLELAKKTGATLTASHVYAAKMHELRFRQMESGLPEEYQVEEELEKQRDIHGQLIAEGMAVITDCYLDIPKNKCTRKSIPFVGKSLEGKNWVELVRDINGSDYDLVIMGILGLGATSESYIGSVCERVVRRIQTDVLIVKHIPELHGEKPSSGKIVVAVDGSEYSFAGVKTAIGLAKILDRPIEIISSYVSTQDNSQSFEDEQRGKCFGDYIDESSKKISQVYLEISRKIVREEGLDCTVRLLGGKALEKFLHYAKTENPFLLILGRLGIHSGSGMDIGGTTENLLRLVPCHVYLSSKVFHPRIDKVVEEAIKSAEHEARV